MLRAFLFPGVSLCCGQAGGDGDDEGNCICDGSEPITPVGGLDMCHFYNNGSDSKGLEEHFYFAGGCGGEVDTACLGNMSQYGDVDFSCDDDGGDCPLNSCHCRWF